MRVKVRVKVRVTVKVRVLVRAGLGIKNQNFVNAIFEAI